MCRVYYIKSILNRLHICKVYYCYLCLECIMFNVINIYPRMNNIIYNKYGVEYTYYYTKYHTNHNGKYTYKSKAFPLKNIIYALFLFILSLSYWVEMYTYTYPSLTLRYVWCKYIHFTTKIFYFEWMVIILKMF